MNIYVIDSNNLINIHGFFVVICMYSFYPLLHVAARFFLKIVKMWVSTLVHDAIHIERAYLQCQIWVNAA